MQMKIRYPVPKVYPILMLETTESSDLYQNDKMQKILNCDSKHSFYTFGVDRAPL